MRDQSNTGSYLSYLHDISEYHVPHISATALLQKAAQVDSTTGTDGASLLTSLSTSSMYSTKSQSQNQLHGLMVSFPSGTSSIFGGKKNQQDNSFGGLDGSEISLQQHHKTPLFSVNVAGSDIRTTLDFLSDGGIVRNMGGGFSQREDQLGIDMGSIEPHMSPSHTGHVFGGSK